MISSYYITQHFEVPSELLTYVQINEAKCNLTRTIYFQIVRNVSDDPPTNSTSSPQNHMAWWIQVAWTSVFSVMVFIAVWGNLLFMWIVLSKSWKKSQTKIAISSCPLLHFHQYFYFKKRLKKLNRGSSLGLCWDRVFLPHSTSLVIRIQLNLNYGWKHVQHLIAFTRQNGRTNRFQKLESH